MVSSLRFLVIGLVYVISLGDLNYTPFENMDFGFLPFDCRLEGAVSYMLLIMNINWNFCWSYDLYLSVTKPMSYTENYFSFYWKWAYIVGILAGIASFSISGLLDSEIQHSTI